MPAETFSRRDLYAATHLRVGEAVQMRGGVFVKLQRPCQRLEYLWGWMHRRFRKQ
jgi:hypothetical protein